MVLDFSLPIIHTQAGTPQISILDPGSHPHHSPLIPPHTIQHPVTKKNIVCLAGEPIQLVLFFTYPKANHV